MINPISPVSFQAKAQYEAAAKLVDRSGKELNAVIKAVSEKTGEYNLDVYVNNAKNIVEAYYGNTVRTAAENSSEFAKNAYIDLRKINKMLHDNGAKEQDNIINGLIEFFVNSIK